MPDPDLLVISTTEAAAALKVPGVETTKLAGIVDAASRRLDRALGPIVQRTVVEEIDGIAGRGTIELRSWPVAEITELLELDSNGDPTTLTRETSAATPDDGFLLTRSSVDERAADGTEIELFLPLVGRRGSGGPRPWGSSAKVTYTAGRFDTTANVTERYREAARLTVVNLYQRLTIGKATVDEFDVPRWPFPAFALPRAVRQLFTPDEWQEEGETIPGIA